VLLWFWQASLPVYFWEVQHDIDWEPTGSLELHRKRGSWKGPKYPRRTLVGETLGLWRGGQVPNGESVRKRADRKWHVFR